MRPPSATAVLPSPELGDRLRERRLTVGLTQREIAAAMGVSKRTYLAWERAESGITWENLSKLAEVLDVSEDWVKLGDELADFPEGPSAALEAIGRQVQEVRDQVVDPDAFVVTTLLDIQARLERIEAALDVEHGLGDETRAAIDATRSVKEAASASAGAADRESKAAAPARDEEGATSAPARAPRAGTRRSGR